MYDLSYSGVHILELDGYGAMLCYAMLRYAMIRYEMDWTEIDRNRQRKTRLGEREGNKIKEGKASSRARALECLIMKTKCTLPTLHMFCSVCIVLHSRTQLS